MRLNEAGSYLELDEEWKFGELFRFWCCRKQKLTAGEGIGRSMSVMNQLPNQRQ